MYCVDTENGAVRWSVEAGSPIWSSASVGIDPEHSASYLLYVGTSAGPVIAFDPSGNRRWSYQPRDVRSDRLSGVNASFALGKSGLATGTIAGDILYIPYDSYLRRTADKDRWTVSSGRQWNGVSTHPASHPSITTGLTNDALTEGASFRITKMQFDTPTIINPFDQIGIASLGIDVVMVRCDSETGLCIAWGVQSFGFEESSNTDGTLYPRRHFYLFSGERRENTLMLEARDCEFEITAFPVPLDILSFTFALNEYRSGNTFHARLNCNYLPLTLLKKYGMYIIRYIAIQTFFNTVSTGTQLYSAHRTCSAVFHGLRKRVRCSRNVFGGNTSRNSASCARIERIVRSSDAPHHGII